MTKSTQLTLSATLRAGSLVSAPPAEQSPPKIKAITAECRIPYQQIV